MFKISSENRRLAENIFFLHFLQLTNYLLPLVTIPYLVRILGPEKFGLIAFAQAFIQYFIIFTDYGFNLSVTRKISIVRNDEKMISRIFSTVYIIKLVSLLVSFVVFLSLIFIIPKFREYWFVYLYTFGMVLGNVLFPIWFYQGTERMKHISFFNVLAKVLFTIAIFLFIKIRSDFVYVPVINSLSIITVGILSLWFARKRFGVTLKFPSMDAITNELKEGWHIFISTMAISLYTSSNTFILGLFTNNTAVGYYSAAEKLINVVQGMLSPITQAVYPFISKLAHESKENALNFIHKLGNLLKITTFFVSAAIFIFARQIVYVILGSQYQQSVIILRILAFIPFIIGTATIYANFYLLAFGYVRQWSRIILSCGLIGVVFSFIFVYMLSLGQLGSSISWFLTECCVLVISYIFYRKLSYANR